MVLEFAAKSKFELHYTAHHSFLAIQRHSEISRDILEIFRNDVKYMVVLNLGCHMSQLWRLLLTLLTVCRTYPVTSPLLWMWGVGGATLPISCQMIWLEHCTNLTWQRRQWWVLEFSGEGLKLLLPDLWWACLLGVASGATNTSGAILHHRWPAIQSLEFPHTS